FVLSRQGKAARAQPGWMVVDAARIDDDVGLVVELLTRPLVAKQDAKGPFGTFARADRLSFEKPFASDREHGGAESDGVAQRSGDGHDVELAERSAGRIGIQVGDLRARSLERLETERRDVEPPRREELDESPSRDVVGDFGTALVDGDRKPELARVERHVESDGACADDGDARAIRRGRGGAHSLDARSGPCGRIASDGARLDPGRLRNAAPGDPGSIPAMSLRRGDSSISMP